MFTSPVADENRARVEPDRLVAFASEVLQTFGVPEADAHLVADSLVAADLWGHQSHGVLRLPWYSRRLQTGAMRPRVEPTTVADAGALVILDGHHGIGQVLTERVRVEAVRRARQYGVGMVGVRNSNHFGTAMYYTRRAAAEGCVAILTTNASPAMAPWGGRTKCVGTNPWSIAAPFGERAVALDIANTAVARGKIYLARHEGRTIPDTWALTADGARTTDPSEAIAGMILPMAGHKGYGISFMMDVLSGALTGSEVGSGVHGPYEADKPSGAGHLFIAVDIASAGSPDDFQRRVGDLVAEVKGVPLAEGFDEVFYPGELEDRAAEQADRDGLFLPAQTVRDLTDLGTQQGVAASF